MPHNIFTLKGVTFAYPNKKPLFRRLNLTVPEGKVTTFLGANGSGKSTLFNLMTKNLTPQAGYIFLRGGNVADIRPADFAKLVAIVHQHNIAPGDLSVRQLVSYGRFPYRHGHMLYSAKDRAEDERMVDWAIGTCNLTDVQNGLVFDLSGGQRQRVWIAMALAQGADVLLLDEPTTYLDVRYQLDILHLVRRLNREHGMTVVMVLHDMNQALQYSDEVIALANGHIAAQGRPDDVVTSELIEQVYSVNLEVTRVHDRPFVLAV